MKPKAKRRDKVLVWLLCQRCTAPIVIAKRTIKAKELCFCTRLHSFSLGRRYDVAHTCVEKLGCKYTPEADKHANSLHKLSSDVRCSMDGERLTFVSHCDSVLLCFVCYSRA